MGAFCEDRLLESAVRELCFEWQVRTVIETGTYIGETTAALAAMAGSVHTVEVNPKFLADAIHTCDGLANIEFHLGRSVDLLPGIIRATHGPRLYFLDAHWPTTPLLDEIAIIAELDPAPVLIIHDVQVPGRPWKFDRYDGQPLCYEWMRPALDNLRCNYLVRYNDEAEGQRVGCMFVTPARERETDSH